ncbi:MAG: MgtC/SapB family protein [Fimbriimonadales bacterium]
MDGWLDPAAWSDSWPTFVRMVLASLLAGAIGWQREAHGRPAGIRTHMLLAIGVVVLTEAGRRLGGDPARVAAQIVTGVGFLGAGAILRMGREIRGLTTAASLWATTGIAMAVAAGSGLAPLAVAATVLALIVLAWVNRIERRLLPDSSLPVVSIDAADGETAAELMALWKRRGRRLRTLQAESVGEGFRVRASFDGSAEDPLQDALTLPGVRSAQLETDR